MGFEKHATALLLKMRSEGVKLGRLLTLGRQCVHLRPNEYRRLQTRIGRTNVATVPKFADELFLALGAQQVDAMDFSSYEGASLVHDLNQPIPQHWHQQYDTVFDGGTLEHVFHFPTAIKNCMQMLKPGGRFISATMPNNWCGHGFYQFSPELFYRVLSPCNGFSVVEMYVAEKKGRVYAVEDPEVVQSRVELCNNRPVYLLVHARRDAVCEIFSHPPQQSDYVPLWAGSPARPVVKTVAEYLRKLRWSLLGRHNFRRSLENRRFYTPVDIRI